ncbi:rhamnogalacturonan acetylesterase [Mucilaginibacter daejeonensis]|uniref:rhamnogalacturonan acetylesterase n=1 Tax=Mucilaginibacter daejeonensis TaxID=398049 RepID=UPI001D175879|nr:rhamnogalacturonan acetylesterase [Mucilaginibacter daejeonensis]UEG53851.1 rhamnogalacturonan acetylesterase [Mucilaginibacter daejeonensis]
MRTLRYTAIILLAAVAMLAFRQPSKPVIYLIGDSTVHNADKETWGWGSIIGNYFDDSKITVNNQAMAGRSTRTFIKENRWHRVDSMLKPGDYVLMQFGHNEGSKPDTNKAGYRGVLNGTGEETVDLTWPNGTKETVHTYGYYLRKFIRETKAKGATPIVLSMIPRNDWKDGKVKRASNDYGKWAKEIADQEGASFIDLNAITADKYDAWGADSVKKHFPIDHTHPNKMGATVNAESIVAGIKANKKIKLNQYLKK